jgi:hypothetical protein
LNHSRFDEGEPDHEFESPRVMSRVSTVHPDWNGFEAKSLVGHAHPTRLGLGE